MSAHLKDMPPAAVLLGREIISVDAKSGEVQLRFLADPQFATVTAPYKVACLPHA